MIDHWWQTETGWAIAANPMGLEAMEAKPGSPTVPMPGYDLHVVGPAGEDVPDGADGEIVIRLPLPPGCLPTLWGDDQRYTDSYLSQHPGYYLTGDGGHLDADGYLFVMGRTDDVINVAGHRLSTGEMEEVLASHPAVAECAVIGISDPIKGQVPRGFVVLKSGGNADPDALRAELVQLIRDQIGPVAALRQVDVVAALPKTRSGKILRKTMRGIAEGSDEPVPVDHRGPGRAGCAQTDPPRWLTRGQPAVDRMKAFVINRHGRLVFPSNAWPRLDFSVFDDGRSAQRGGEP